MSAITGDGKLFFKNVQNLITKLEGPVKTYAPEQAIKELREWLDDPFRPTNRWCYQLAPTLPAVDEIELRQDETTLVITEPYQGSALRPELQQFYDQARLDESSCLPDGHQGHL